MEPKDEKKLKALIVYYSATGNTRKVAEAIHDGLLSEKVESTLCTVQDAAGKEF